MTEHIEDLDVYASGYRVGVSSGNRFTRSLAVKARVNADTGEVTFHVDPAFIHLLRKD